MAAKHAAPSMKNGTYDFLKYLALVVLPGLGAAYFGLDALWDLPYEVEVVGTVTVVEVFLGSVLGLSKAKYDNSDAPYDGKLLVNETEDKKLYSFELNDDVENLQMKPDLRFKVQPVDRL